ncbi:MAG: peptidylprolyl isomerase [Desulfuromonadales bacterium]|nr:peptidylprolyl isomerase [Desulfuromonadales bacterium]
MLRSFSLVVVALSLLTSNSFGAESNIVAKVGSISVTNFELQREIRKKIPLEVAYHSGMKPEKIEKIKSEALEQLVERSYKVQYALDNKLSVAPEELDKRMQAFVGQYATPELLAKALGGETLEAYRVSVYRQLLAEKAEEVAVGSKATVSEQELKNYYETNQKRYFRPLQFKASHVLVQVDPAATPEEIAKRKTRAETLLARAKAAEDFYNLAYYESDDRSRYVGGSLGYFHEGQTVAEFDEAVKHLKPGEVSGLVRTRWGFHIIKLDERNEARQLEYAEVKDKIHSDLEKERRTAIYRDWMTDLRKRYPAEAIK